MLPAMRCPLGTLARAIRTARRASSSHRCPTARRFVRNVLAVWTVAPALAYSS